MHSSMARNCRNGAGYHPGKTLVEYEKPVLHHVGRMPTYEKHTRVIRELGPWVGGRRHVVERTVEKIIMSRDGKTPRHPIMALVTDPKTGKQAFSHQTELVPVYAPIRLKAGSPKAIYRGLKKMERRHGLTDIYAALHTA